MSASKRLLTVLLVARLFFVVGAIGVVRHAPELVHLRQDTVWVELTELLAVVIGVFLFLGYNWARWLAVAWMVFHIAINWSSVGAMAVHALIFALLTWASSTLPPIAISPGHVLQVPHK